MELIIDGSWWVLGWKSRNFNFLNVLWNLNFWKLRRKCKVHRKLKKIFIFQTQTSKILRPPCIHPIQRQINHKNTSTLFHFTINKMPWNFFILLNYLPSVSWNASEHVLCSQLRMRSITTLTPSSFTFNVRFGSS